MFGRLAVAGELRLAQVQDGDIGPQQRESRRLLPAAPGQAQDIPPGRIVHHAFRVHKLAGGDGIQVQGGARVQDARLRQLFPTFLVESRQFVQHTAPSK